MSTVRIALANIRVPTTPEESVCLATSAVADASRRGAVVVCFPECFVPGYRWPGTTVPSPDPAFLERAWGEVADAARAACITVILGTERVTSRGLQTTACVINSDGSVAGWQDKGQVDPSEEAIYPALANERRVFTAGSLTFGVVICHEGFAIQRRYGGPFVGARRSSFTHTRMSPARGPIAPARSRIPPIPFTRKPCCVALRKTHAISRP